MPHHRKPTPHVRSGCRTCKIRHIKCDEQRPACRKCLSSGRYCDGYGIWSQPANAPSLAPKQTAELLRYPPNTLPDLAHEEKRQLSRFRNLLTEKLAQPFGSPFWSSLVIQLSQSEPAVLHASIALTSAHEWFAQSHGKLDFSSLAPGGLFSLRQYNRAIRALVSQESLESVLSLRIAIVSCVLFICLEILRGDVNAMQAHFGAGIKLLRQVQHLEHRLPAPKNTIFVNHEPESFDDHLVDVFAGLNMQFLMLGHGPQQKEAFSPSFQYGRHVNIPRHFCTARQAHQSIGPILLSSIHFIMETEQLSLTTGVHPSPPSATMLEKRRALEADISDWTASYENSIDSYLASIPWNERLGLVMLRVYAEMSTILLATSFSTKETAYDPHLPKFKWIIQRYREFHSSNVQLEAQKCGAHPFFTIDVYLFPPLYFTALKCRARSTRHQALLLLRQYYHMEGPWTGAMLAVVAGHVIKLEEKHFEYALESSLGVSDSLAQTSPSSEPSIVLPEFARIHCVECKLPDRRDQDSHIASLTLKRFRHELGKNGGWDVNKYNVDFVSPP